jgi:hypothetical protein
MVNKKNCHPEWKYMAYEVVFVGLSEAQVAQSWNVEEGDVKQYVNWAYGQKAGR